MEDGDEISNKRHRLLAVKKKNLLTWRLARVGGWT